MHSSQPETPGEMGYRRPASLDDALATLAGGGVRIVAGCTDVFPATADHILRGQVLDITGIPALRGIHSDAHGWTLGATTTWSDIVRAELPPAFHCLQLAAREVGATQIQNRGTLAGNLCNASPAADGVPPLLVLDAQVELASSDGVRRLPLQRFLTGPRKTALRPGEMLTAVHIPATSEEGVSSFSKLGSREYLVISIAMCAARLFIQDGRVHSAALAVGACGPVATRLAAVEKALVGKAADPSLVEDEMVAQALAPIDDVRADAGYRARAAAELVRRTVAAVAAGTRP